jgi:hypothetical protein
MKSIALVAVLLLLPTGGALHGQERAAISLVKTGVDAYLKEGPTAALKTWIKGSPMEGNAEALSQANILKQIEELYGNFEGFDTISDITLSSRSHLIYFVLYYGKGSVYCNFETYKTKSGQWVLGEINFHTKSSKILPESIRSPH